MSSQRTERANMYLTKKKEQMSTQQTGGKHEYTANRRENEYTTNRRNKHPARSHDGLGSDSQE